MSSMSLRDLMPSNIIKKAEHYYEDLLVLREGIYSQFQDKRTQECIENLISEDYDFHRVYILYVIDRIVGRYERNEEKPYYTLEILPKLFSNKVPFKEKDYIFMLNRTADIGRLYFYGNEHMKKIISLLEEYLKSNDISEGIVKGLLRFYKGLLGADGTPEKGLRARINVLLNDRKMSPLLSGEAWSDQVYKDFEQFSIEQKKNWIELFDHCSDSSAGKPTKTWLKKAEELVKKIGLKVFRESMESWLPLVNKPRTAPPQGSHSYTSDNTHLLVESNISILKGLAWCCSQFNDKKMARCLRDLAISAFKKIPDKGPRAVRLGNACIYSLSVNESMEALHQLAFLKIKIRFKSALKLIEKSLNSAAERLSVSRAELEEMSVPEYGLTEVGLLEEEMSDFTARMQILDSNKIELKWIKLDDKVQKSVPTAIKKDHAESLKELKATMKDIQKMIPAQKERIQNLYLQNKQWNYPIWKERYLDHPLTGTLARRLVWKFKNNDTVIDGIYCSGNIVDVDGKCFDAMLGEGSTVELWHPLGHDVEYIKKWRGKLIELEIKQPFKQTYREVYVLTDAERQTRVYSNRYAAHIVKQHQFNSLCGARGWKNSLKLMVDAEYPPPSVTLPVWNLRAEFWTDGAGEEYGQDTNETGTYLYLVTDQVRFFHMDSPQSYAHSSERGQAATTDPVPLEDIPPLVFSEVMRDIDLFVGVASVGNDPEWGDAGPEGHQRYWQHYSFGDLTQRAETRKQVLMDLVPRLAIAEKCSFDGKFLRVQGKIRAYKIHLGSGNILMEPNDSYLCIVRNRTKEMKDGTSKLFLPFEGDETLSVVISKALLLANDDRIKDSTIVSQIKKF